YSVFRIPYSVFRIPYSVFRIPYSVFRIPYSVFSLNFKIFNHRVWLARFIIYNPFPIRVEPSNVFQSLKNIALND
ncbi:MAG TPA: hypothetical protein EYG48_09860, partial [Methylococcales bacterium]|nr:hypothetical protein [Methylococcales bacterium]